MNILTVIGARPQFIKAAVLSRYIRDNPSRGITETLVHTGQHYDKNMSDVFFDEMDIPKPDVNLHVGSGTHGAVTGRMLELIEKELIVRKPDAVLVYGDTNSTLAGALASGKLHIPVAHVEAGLRSYMMEMPEEQNRRLTDHLSTWLFCPTLTAENNLNKEGIIDYKFSEKTDANHKHVVVSGDIMYDAFLYYREKPPPTSPHTHASKLGSFILLTIHRAENTDNPERLRSIVNAVNDLKTINFIFPVHPRTRKILSDNNLILKGHTNLIDPIGYLDMLFYESACDAVLTDSGGVQKEAFFFKKPCITMRDTTEWVELVESGWNTLTGADSQKIISAINSIQIPSEYPDFYGNGHCAEKIIDVLQNLA
jgi:UDP-GlcNAc3NAcA epimerase